MLKLALMIYVMAAPTLAGMALVAVLTVGANTGNPIMLSVLVGALAAIPVALFIAKKLSAVKGLIKQT